MAGILNLASTRNRKARFVYMGCQLDEGTCTRNIAFEIRMSIYWE
jgi:hypothetical protein